MKETNKVDLGSIKIHKQVLAEITYAAVKDLKDVSFTAKDLMGNLGEFMGLKTYPGIFVHLDKNNQVSIEVKINVNYGVNIPDIARQVQDAIRMAIEKTVDIDLKDVHVNIQGIERREK